MQDEPRRPCSSQRRLVVMTDHYQDDGLTEAEKPDLYLVVGAAVAIMLVCLVLHALGFWEHRTFREFWQP